MALYFTFVTLHLFPQTMARAHIVQKPGTVYIWTPMLILLNTEVVSKPLTINILT